ncbi:MAG: YceD family protein [Maritimibacter sp.]
MADQNTDIQNTSELGPQLVVAELKSAKRYPIEITLPPEVESRLAQTLELQALRKTRLTGVLAPLGKRDWQFEGHLGATVVQPCVVTLEPVTTRIEDPVMRSWKADFDPYKDNEDEIDVTEQAGDEALGSVIDMGAVLMEALALALPQYPRRDGAALDTQVFTEPGQAPMTDEDARPFAGLAALKSKLENGGSDD